MFGSGMSARMRLRNRADHRGRNHVAGKRLPSRSVRAAGERVVHDCRRAAEIAIPELYRRNNRTLNASGIVDGALIVAEEECPVAPMGPPIVKA